MIIPIDFYLEHASHERHPAASLVESSSTSWITKNNYGPSGVHKFVINRWIENLVEWRPVTVAKFIEQIDDEPIKVPNIRNSLWIGPSNRPYTLTRLFYVKAGSA